MSAVRGRVFLSYRRDDTRHIAGRIADRLAGANRGSPGLHGCRYDRARRRLHGRPRPGRGGVLMCCSRSSAQGWISDVERRHSRNDFVLLEIGTALTRGIRVVPVLVDGAAMPTEEALPPAIRNLTRRNAVRLDHETFRSDVERLLTAVEKALQPDRATSGAPTNRFPSGRTDHSHPERPPGPSTRLTCVHSGPAPIRRRRTFPPGTAPARAPGRQPRPHGRHPAALPVAGCLVLLAVAGIAYGLADRAPGPNRRRPPQRPPHPRRPPGLTTHRSWTWACRH